MKRSSNGFKLNDADRDFSSRCKSTFSSLNLSEGHSLASNSSYSELPKPVQGKYQVPNSSSSHNIVQGMHRSGASFRKYTKYSLNSVCASQKYGNLRGDALNSAVALEFLKDLRNRKTHEVQQKQSSSKVKIQNASKVVMPEFEFNSQPKLKKHRTRVISDEEEESVSCVQKGRAVTLTHLMENDEDEYD